MEKATAAVLELIESAEMRGYLKKAGDTLPLRVWLEAAAGAPAPLEKKLTVLERIVLAQTEPGARRLAEEYCRAAARALEALTRPQTPGTVFQLVQVSAAEDSNRMERDDVFLFTEWKAAQAFARAYLDELYEDEPPEEKARSWYWYELTLCRPEEGGMLRPGPYTYLLSAAGEAWLFMRERPDGKGTPQPEEDFWWSGLSLNLPVPFRPGDILTVDCRPFAGPGRCLVLEVGDNRDCCCVQVLLPAPFSPSRAWISPRRSWRVMSSLAMMPGNSLVMWSISMMFSAAMVLHPPPHVYGENIIQYRRENYKKIVPKRRCGGGTGPVPWRARP